MIRHLGGSGRGPAPACTPENRSRNIRLWLFVTGLLVVLFIYAAHSWYFHDYINDDAYITFRYSYFLAAGEGPYFNPGEHVEGYTSFLWMLIMATVILVLGPSSAPALAKVLGASLGAGAIVVVVFLTRYLLIRATQNRTWAAAWSLAAGGLIAVSPAVAVNSVSGLETGLFMFLLTAGTAVMILEIDRGRWFGSGLLLAGAALARPEGVALAGLLWAAAAVAMIRRPAVAERTPSRTTGILARNVLVLAAIIGGHFILRYYLYDGEWLPNTYWAKRVEWFLPEALAYIESGASGMMAWPYGSLVILVGVALLRKLWRLFLPLFLLGLTGLLLPLLTGPDWMPGWRFLVPYVPVLSCLLAVGAAAILYRVAHARVYIAIALAAACPALFWFLQAGSSKQIHDLIELRARGYRSGHMALAEWLHNGAAKPGETVALMDIGIVGFRCPELRILDITGLTDRYIAKSEGGFLAKQYSPRYILDQAPSAVILTLTAPGQPYTEPSPRQSFKLWSEMERRLYFDPRFRQSYFETTAPEDSRDWHRRVAGKVGADLVLEHAYPGHYYLLTAFTRHTGS